MRFSTEYRQPLPARCNPDREIVGLFRSKVNDQSLSRKKHRRTKQEQIASTGLHASTMFDLWDSTAQAG